MTRANANRFGPVVGGRIHRPQDDPIPFNSPLRAPLDYAPSHADPADETKPRQLWLTPAGLRLVATLTTAGLILLGIGLTFIGAV